MKQTVFALCTICTLILTEVHGQDLRINLKAKNAHLREVFSKIEKKTDFYFAYMEEDLKNTNKVTFEVKDATIQEILDQCLQGQPLSYSINKPFISIKKTYGIQDTAPTESTFLTANGVVTDENNVPIRSVSIIRKGTDAGTSTDSSGKFFMSDLTSSSILLFTSIGYESQTKTVNGEQALVVRMKKSAQNLDESIVIAYGKTSARFNTGAVTKVKGEDIRKQPVCNPLLTLEGRVPGLTVTQTNGFATAAIKAELRGNSSLGNLQNGASFNEPLILVDEVPFAPNINLPPSIGSGSALGTKGTSLLSIVNTHDIESIEVLKDADATAIYGSRGGNGVILITTKQADSGKIRFGVNAYWGASTITRSPEVLNTTQFLQMRMEGFKNDGLVPNSLNAPDLLGHNPTHFIDLKKYLIGRNAQLSNVEVSVAGGSKNTRIRLGIGLRRESTVFPEDLSDNRQSLHLRLYKSAFKKKLEVNMSGMFSNTKNNSTIKDPTSAIFLAPNIRLLDSTGEINWSNQPGFVNPNAYLLQKYMLRNENILLSTNFSYKVFKNLKFKSNLGFSSITQREVSFVPKASLNPFGNSETYGSSFFGKMEFKNHIVEPQLEFKGRLSEMVITILVGGTYNFSTTTTQTISATGYENDNNLPDTSAAEFLNVRTMKVDYKYAALFGRMTLNFHNQYLANLTARRDGSSRFGPSEQYGNFGAVGLSWIFSQTDFVNDKLRFLSFGKIRASFGITGNDQIGDYKFMDGWSSAPFAYLGNQGLIPTQLPIPSYGWEESKKVNVGLDLGFIDNRMFFSTNFYQHRTSNVLVSSNLPATTGVNSIPAKNSGAVIHSTGVELGLEVAVIKQKNLSLTNKVFMTFSRDKLDAFPELTNTQNPLQYIVGKSPRAHQGFRFLGVNSETGVFSFEDRDGDGALTYQNDYVFAGDLDPKWYGGMATSMTWNNWSIDILLQWKKQDGYNHLYGIYSSGLPGVASKNQLVAVLDRWQRPGDRATIQRYTTGTNPEVLQATDNFLNSDGIFSDASYARLKNFSVAYTFSAPLLKKFHLVECRFYVSAQNILTMTRYKGADPETQSFNTLPPMKTIVVGLQCTL